MAPSVARALQAIHRYGVAPEQIDHAVLSAINVTLYLASGGNDRVSDGFNQDIAENGRDFGRWMAKSASHFAAPASPQNKLS